MFKKVLVPYDGTSFSNKALKTAKEMAECYDLELLVLDVVAVPGVTVASASDITNADKMTTNPVIEAAKAIIGDSNIKVSYKIAMGDVVKTIVNVCRAEQCKLIVMGNRGLSGISEVLMGSVSHKVVELSNIPVMIVK